MRPGVARVLVGVMGLAGGWAFAAEARAQLPDPSELSAMPDLQAKPARTKAQPGRTQLDYHVAPGLDCDDETAFRTWIASDIAADDPFVQKGPPLFTVRVDVIPWNAGVRGVYELRDAQDRLLAQREIISRRCHGVLDWLSLDMALTVFLEPPSCENACVRDLRAEVAELRAELHAALERERREREAATRALQTAVEAIRVRRMDLTYAVVGGVLLSANLTPDVGPGVYAGGELRAGPLGIGLELRAVLPSRVQIGPYDTDWSEYVALLVPCGRYSYFFGCAVAGGGFNLDHDSNAPGKIHSTTGSMWRLGGRLGAELPFAENRLAVRAWGEVLYTTPHVYLDYVSPSGVVAGRWDQPDVSAFFGVGFVVKFGSEETR